VNRQLIRYQLPAILWAVLIFVSSSIPSDRLPPLGVFGIDKVIHFVMFFVFCLLAHRAFRFQSGVEVLSRHNLIFSIAVTILYGISDELHQILVPGRQSSVYDALADALGGLFYAGLYRLWSHWHQYR
jgi:VanZ family protein